MKLFSRSLLIILLVFLMRTLSGCFNYPCKDEVYYFDFTGISILNIDNSGLHPALLHNDTMNSGAVAFQISMQAQPGYILKAGELHADLGFSSAYAWSKTDCPVYYIANQPVKSISVKSLLEINSSISSGSDVSDLFLGSAETGWYDAGLYTHLGKLCQEMDHSYTNYMDVKFRLFLGRNIENDSAQFIVQVNLMNDSVLCDTTHLIFIR